MKIAVLAICLVSLGLTACRREVPSYEPMKLGGTTQHSTTSR